MACSSGAFSDISDTKDSELVEQWYKQSTSVSVLVIGRTGVGKSSLINSLAGSDVAREGDSCKPETVVVESYKIKYSNPEGGEKVELTLWDTPGLEDDDRDPEETLREIEAKCNPTKVDLVFFCVPLNEHRIAKGDKSTAVAFTNKFGVDMWDNAVIAFTCANEIQPKPGSSESQHFVRKLDEWRTGVHEALLTKAKVPKEKVQTIPTIPTGYRQCSLPDRSDWITILWACSYNKAKQDAQPAFIKISRFSKRFAWKDDMTSADKQEMEPQYRKVVVDRYSEEEIAKLSGLPSMSQEWRVLVGGTAGLATGALIGSLVGIVGGPPGIVLGVTFGCMVGGGIGALIGASVVKFLKKRKNPCYNE